MIIVGILALIALLGAGAGFIFFRILLANSPSPGLSLISYFLGRIVLFPKLLGVFSAMICA